MNVQQDIPLVEALKVLRDGDAHVCQSGHVFLRCGSSTHHSVKSLGFSELTTDFLLVSRASADGHAFATPHSDTGSLSQLAQALLVAPVDATTTSELGAAVVSDRRNLGLQISQTVNTNLLLPLPYDEARVVLSRIGPGDSLPALVIAHHDGYLVRWFSPPVSGQSSYTIVSIKHHGAVCVGDAGEGEQIDMASCLRMFEAADRSESGLGESSSHLRRFSSLFNLAPRQHRPVHATQFSTDINEPPRLPVNTRLGGAQGRNCWGGIPHRR